jgi:pentatricopeptide repeat protein
MTAVYGSFTGGDPRKFSPDPECSTEAERGRHRKACDLWDEMEAKGETPTPEKCPSGYEQLPDGSVIHVLRAPYGLGVQEYDDDFFEEEESE